MKYSWVAGELGLDVVADGEAALVLDSMVEKTRPDRLKSLIKGRTVVIFGAGPSLKEGVLFAKKKGLHKSCCFIAADGAVSALLEEEVLPDILVSDLDGNLKDILEANLRGSLTLVHAHSDNVKRLRLMVPRLKSVVGTTQVEPTSKLFNFGGFTDGDRCVHLAVYFKAREILLAGMDFGEVIGEYSGRFDRKKKLKKLKIAEKLIEELKKETKIPIRKLC